MAKEGSVAPKERVNIVYKSSTGGAQEEVELPFRFLVVGDFTGRPENAPIEQRPMINVDKGNFDEVLAGQDVRLEVSVPDELTQQKDSEINVALQFKRMKDFSPDAICQEVPELNALVGLRDALTMLKGPLGNVPAFRKRLQALLSDSDAQKRLLEELTLAEKESPEK